MASYPGGLLIFFLVRRASMKQGRLFFRQQFRTPRKKTGGLSLPFNGLSDQRSDRRSDLHGLQFNKLAEAVRAEFTAVA